MKHWSCHGSLWPRAFSRAMTSVAASSTTVAPLHSNRRRTAVFPAPGVPVRMYLIIAYLLGGGRGRDDKAGRAGGEGLAGGVGGTPKVRLGRMCCSGITAPPCDADWQWLNRRERLAQSVMAWVQVYERLGERGELHRPGTKTVLLVL